MKFIVGAAWLYAFLVLGEAVARAAHLPIPGSVAGMILLWTALGVRLVRLEWVEAGARGLLGVLGLLFVPAGAGLVRFLHAPVEWAVTLAAILVSAFAVMAVTGLLVQRSAP